MTRGGIQAKRNDAKKEKEPMRLFCVCPQEAKIAANPLRKSTDSSINDEELDAGLGVRTVRLGIIRDLIAGAGGEDKFPAVGKFSVKLAFEAQKDVAL